MRHEHSHDHGHAHGHGHAHAHAAAPAEREPVLPSVLMSGAAIRVAAVLTALALLWGAVAWALTDLSA
jgi:hypothetical protein